MERSEGGEYEAGGEAVARTRPKAPTERSVFCVLLYVSPWGMPPP
ncbi:hypothetical protein N8703_04650 [Verrucomicrobia bacterium]|nr:hypothetical protein [Verrucomicrobiota bacterium]